MKWEEIDTRARQMVLHLMSSLTGAEDENVPERGNPDCQALLEHRIPLLELENRKKYDYHKAFRRIRQERNRRRIGWISAVACGIALVFGAVLFFRNRETGTGPAGETLVAGEAGKVVLQLGSGEQVVLSGKDSLQLQEAGKTIQAGKDQITYIPQSNNPVAKESRYNTLTVPRSAEYRVVLADGSAAHLNADSELKYPVNFADGKREVYLKGEAWFEVASDSSQPFYVITEEVKIRVYGTRFNVNTHSRKTVQTVLVEGSIGLQAKGVKEEMRMHPGQLAEYERQSRQIQLKEVDVRQYTAWKEGVFYFNDETLEEIMEELARWYDLEVIFYADAAKKFRFSGHLERYKEVRKILNTITESTGVTIEESGKTITIK